MHRDSKLILQELGGVLSRICPPYNLLNDTFQIAFLAFNIAKEDVDQSGSRAEHRLDLRVCLPREVIGPLQEYRPFQM